MFQLNIHTKFELPTCSKPECYSPTLKIENDIDTKFQLPIFNLNSNFPLLTVRTCDTCHKMIQVRQHSYMLVISAK